MHICFTSGNCMTMIMMMKWNMDATETSLHANAKRNHLHTTPFSSNFPRGSGSTNGKHYFSVTSIIILWYVILLCWCGPQYVVNGLPLVITRSSSIPPSDKDVMLDSSLILRDGFITSQHGWHWYLQNKNMLKQGMDLGNDDGDSSSVQEATGSDKTYNNNALIKMMQPRMKKGLSYLTKYYTKAFLNNTPNSSGSGGSRSANSNTQSHHDSSNLFFGIGGGGSSASGEQRFPSSVRRKLSLYPAMTSHSVFMSPWSRVSGNRAGNAGRSPTMRLRWGK